uniref:Uncharacterized protein n=1 Tax=viral metagenome TaxID=1070528 RepID=A0A6M3M4H4_9ZZZZ
MTVREEFIKALQNGFVFNSDDILPLVRDFLELGEYDGLFFPGECGCEIDDLAPCGESCLDCEPGYKRVCELEEEYNFYIQAEKP